ncbi:MAG: SAM-dependent methyltransferase [Propionibacteriaceae bacterium]|jgi:tRNA-Thr(GGU) m(6)t(6)A37 methyltransferase TsaA|nr:SAM-dependent methyltransferase [Propionibacteriaceae bacterium]
MTTTLIVRPIGEVRKVAETTTIAIDPGLAPALRGLDGFSHLMVIWWFSHCDNAHDRAVLSENSPYRGAPDTLGTFATRSPMRPNPIAVTCAEVIGIDHDSATITVTWLDADEGSPVLDIKPYTPSADRVETPHTPQWCAHWPGSFEQSGDFDWANQFTFDS